MLFVTLTHAVADSSRNARLRRETEKLFKSPAPHRECWSPLLGMVGATLEASRAAAHPASQPVSLPEARGPRPAPHPAAPGGPRPRRRSRPMASPSSPSAAQVRWQQDPYGNRVARVTFPDGVRVPHLEVTVELAVDVRPVNPFDFFLDDRCEKVPFAYPAELRQDLAPVPRRERAGGARRRAPQGLPRRAAALRAHGAAHRPAQRAGEPAHPVHHPRGDGHLHARGDARGGQGQLPGLGDAADRRAALARAGGALRERLPGAAHRRGDDPQRAARRGARRGRSARLGGGVPARRRAGSGSTRPAAC